MDFIPYKINECFEYKFYQIPIELFINPLYINLDVTSKLLYGVLLNRFTLSAKNNWYDKNGNIYLIFTRKEVQKLLNLSDKTVTKAFKQLNDVKLIYEKKQGKNKPNLIYVGRINHDENLTKVTRKKAESVKVLPVTESVYRKIYDSGIVNSTTPDTEILRGSNIDNNYTKRKSKKLFFGNFNQDFHSDIEWDALYDN